MRNRNRNLFSDATTHWCVLVMICMIILFESSFVVSLPASISSSVSVSGTSSGPKLDSDGCLVGQDFNWNKEGVSLIFHNQGQMTDRAGHSNRLALLCVDGPCQKLEPYHQIFCSVTHRAKSEEPMHVAIQPNHNPTWQCSEVNQAVTIRSFHLQCQNASPKRSTHCKRLGSCSLDISLSSSAPNLVNDSVYRNTTTSNNSWGWNHFTHLLFDLTSELNQKAFSFWWPQTIQDYLFPNSTNQTSQTSLHAPNPSLDLLGLDNDNVSSSRPFSFESFAASEETINYTILQDKDDVNTQESLTAKEQNDHYPSYQRFNITNHDDTENITLSTTCSNWDKVANLLNHESENVMIVSRFVLFGSCAVLMHLIWTLFKVFVRKMIVYQWGQEFLDSLNPNAPLSQQT